MATFLTKLAGKFLPVAKIKQANGDFSRFQYDKKDDQLSGIILWCKCVITVCLTYR